MAGSGGKRTIRFWALKIAIISLILSAGISIAAEVFMENLPLLPAMLVLFALIAIGILFDIIGVAFASCEQSAFISMSAKRIRKATVALRLLKNADVVSSICNDVVGDICGIVSGSAGTAIAAMLYLRSDGSVSGAAVSIAVASITAAMTVGGKALGKKFAIRNNRAIVERIGAVCAVFSSKSGRKKKGRRS